METGHTAVTTHRRQAWTVNQEAEPSQAPQTSRGLGQSSSIHRWCQNIVQSSWLNKISIFVTLLSCIVEINCSFCADDNPNIKMWINGGLLVYLTFEMLVKIIATGLYSYEGSYLRSVWNLVDVVIYFALMLNIVLDGCNVHIPVSEPLKVFILVSKLPSIRKMVLRLSGILPMLANTFCLFMFFIHIFAILGIQLWAGELHHRCFLGEDVLMKYNVSLNPYYQSGNGDTFICSPDASNGMRHCSDVPPHRENGKVCTRAPPHHRQTLLADWHGSTSECMNWNAFYNVCRADGPNPNWGSTNFDNIGYAWITTFQVITLIGWTDIMHMMMDTYSFWSFLFFLPLTFVGSFIIMNMCAVVIAMCFMNTRQNTGEAQSAEAAMLKTLCMSFINGLTGCLGRLTGCLGRLTGCLGRLTGCLGRLTGCLGRLTGCLGRSQSEVAPRSSHSQNNASGLWHRLLRKLEVLVKGELFSQVFMVAIFANIITMALEHHNQPQVMTQMLMICNIIFVIVFTVEMVLKILGLQWQYFSDQSNLFDFAIVIVSFWELATGTEGKLSVLRALRVLRFLRLIGFFPSLSRQLLVLIRTFKEASMLCILLMFFTVIFSFLGMHLFGCTSKASAIREDFDSLLWSMVTVFQIMTEESWNLVLYNAIASTSTWAALYFVVVILFGRYVLLNILVGIVVQSFHVQDPPQPQERDSNTNRVVAIELHREDDNVLPNAVQDHGSPQPQERDSNTNRVDAIEFVLPNAVQDHGSPQPQERDFNTNRVDAIEFVLPNAVQDHDSPQPQERDSNTNRVVAIELHREDDTVLPNAVQDHSSLTGIQRVPRWFKDREDWSLFLLSPQNKWRVFCKNVISHAAFDIGVLFCILMNCITIALEMPSIQPGSTERQILDVTSYGFTFIFSLEMLLKVTASGLMLGKDSYCRSTWNIIDGLVVMVSLVDIIIQVSTKTNTLVIFKVLRLLRILRPLRMINKSSKLKLALEALIAAVKVMGNILVLSFFFFFIYGIVGVQLFQGTFYHCMGQNLTGIVTKSDCLSATYDWVQKPYHFDNLLQAFLSLFVMYSMDGWVNIMNDGVNAVGVDQQPVKRYNPWVLLYFMSFMMMSFILLDMFIGAMVDTFHKYQKKKKPVQEPGPVVLPDQENDADELSPTRRCLQTFCKSKALNFLITAGIIINVLMMSVEHYNQPEYIDEFTEYSFVVFTIILTAELLLKIAVFGLKNFIKCRWNVLDVAIVLVSIISIVLTEMELEHVIPFNPGILRVCRMLRVSQVLRAKNIQVLLSTLVKTLSQVGNIGLLFIFFFYIYAVLGVELFGNLECSIDYPCKGLNHYSNFKNFGAAVLTLYKVCTGDGWSSILRDTMRDCPPGRSNCSSNLRWPSVLYFVTFTVIAQFVLANLVVAVIMQALEDSTEEKTEQDPSRREITVV